MGANNCSTEDGSCYLLSVAMGNSCTGSNKDKEEEKDDNHRLLEVLQLLDIDGDGFVGERDLRESPWTKYSAAGASEILKVFDRDRDGKLNQEEFANWYRHGRLQCPWNREG